MSLIKETLEKSIFDQMDETVTTPVSIRLPTNLSNELDELSLTLDKSKSYLLLEFIKAGIKETNALLEERYSNPSQPEERDPSDFLNRKYFMLNTNYNNDEKSHYDMLKNQEAAAFCKDWKGYICHLSKGDTVYLYQSGVGIVASGVVSGDLEKHVYNGVPDDKYSKKLEDFKVGFKAISAKQFKDITNGGANFRRTMVELTLSQGQKVKSEIEERLKNIQ
ncbi:hypothetical protein [Ectopseudomonas oleovorans]|uniref:Ribbon-helix-helix domain-containing protein n=1 Tax=Ectopseudomonas oleovorans TaxID=301 RepID=A0AA42TX91_ECTOL|nr:hypothetical protein [Pseudomonas oleovorans]MDH1338059.1 ribbon-helix-helix domain-containing protein [Pseudomonas oleovorans]MDH1494067.1 ribbon-helix-helix domain-containing protein [Pseudomonas oleovorans]WGG19994.1 ribbon-helix-helix domain-containing protein [Pseudomonas oleovorans]